MKGINEGSEIITRSKHTLTSINNMASVHEPILVLYKSNMCRHCAAVSDIWNTAPNGGESIVSAVKKVYPKLRFYTLTAKDNTGKFDENIAPKDLIRYGKWYPMILLIPGPIWDAAMSKLGPKNDVEILNGVQIMNGKMSGKNLEYTQKYDIRKPSEFAKWIREALANEEFIHAQEGSNTASTSSVSDTTNHKIVVPTKNPSQPIKPLLNNIVRPSNTSTNYVSADTRPEGLGDICSMRIIPRPK